MSNHDLEALVRGAGDPLERTVLESARTDVPTSNAKAQMLASLGLAKPSSAARAPAPAPRKIGGRYVYGFGLALVIGAGAAAIVSSSRVDEATSSMPSAPSVANEVAPPVAVAAPVIPPSPPAVREEGLVARPEPAVVEAPVERAPSAPPHRKQETAPRPTSVRREPTPSSASSTSSVASPSRPPNTTPSAAPSASGSSTDAAESTLARELARVAAARSALASGDAVGTLQLLDSYDSEFPSGVFTVEVSVLRIEALARSGKIEEATRLGDRFLARHPQGVLARRVAVILKSVDPSRRDPASASSRD